MRKNLLKTLVAAAAVMAASSAAQAYQISLDGHTYTFDSIDWSSGGSAWIYNYSGVQGSQFDLAFMSKAVALQLGNTKVYEFTGNTEMTVYAQLNETIVSDDGFGGQRFSLNNGSWSIYVDAANNGDLTTGYGITDGTKILSGSFKQGASGTFAIDGLPGQNNMFNEPSGGTGSQSLPGNVLFAAGWVLPQPTGATTSSQLNVGSSVSGWVKPTGFAAASGGGIDPNYKVCGDWNDPAADLACGIYLSNGQQVMQADGSSFFRGAVPEPASMALVGLGLGLAALRRRTAKA